jgi:hypothetical protein
MSPLVRICPECGCERQVVCRIREGKGSLEELPQRLRLRELLKLTDKRAVWAQLKYIQENRGYKPGWVAHKYQEIFGVWPRGVEGPAQQPSREMWDWFRTRGEFWNMVKRRRNAP